MAFGVHFTDLEVVFLDPSPAVLKLPLNEVQHF
jgi:hypothetical protein